MTPLKRVLDLCVVLVAGLILALPFALVVVAVLVTQGRPLFYVSERMKSPGQPFRLWKLRTMSAVPGDSGVSGGDKRDRVTPVGRILRRIRFDEVPQLWNVLRGDMSFVGPRPPLRQYTERFPEIYGEVLKSRPGVTGLASLHFHRHEERLLGRCTTAAETDDVYVRRCIPRKARLDLIYARRRNVCTDIALMYRTLGAALGGRRRARRRRFR